MDGFGFEIKNRIGRARTGVITTPHGKINTPEFFPVATCATVKAVSQRELKELKSQLLLANTYHLHLRPGEKLIKEFGGLHGFMNWDGPILTDSGGFQVFSLGFGIEHQVSKIGSIFPDEAERDYNPQPAEKLARVDDDGVTFKSPVDGKIDRLTPECSIQIQEDLGADIILAFDECTSPLSSYEYTKLALARTHRWAERSLAAHKRKDQALYGIIQGGAYKDLREESTKFISSLSFDGIAIGGSLGKSRDDMHTILDWCIPMLPEGKPRHLLGIGSIEDLFHCVERGIDTFDCVMPTRHARVGYLLITPQAGGTPENKFRMSLKNACNREDRGPIDPTCNCYTCRTFSRAYLRHLFCSEELLFYNLASIHNLNMVLRLMERIREAIDNGTFQELKREWIKL